PRVGLPSFPTRRSSDLALDLVLQGGLLLIDLTPTLLQGSRGVEPSSKVLSLCFFLGECALHRGQGVQCPTLVQGAQEGGLPLTEVFTFPLVRGALLAQVGGFLVQVPSPVAYDRSTELLHLVDSGPRLIPENTPHLLLG